MPRIKAKIAGMDLTFAAIMLGPGREMQEEEGLKPTDFNIAFVVASLRASKRLVPERVYSDNPDFAALAGEITEEDGEQFKIRMVDPSIAWLNDNIPNFDGSYKQCLEAAFNANGMKLEKPKAGESEPAAGDAPAPAAESTSTTSTDASGASSVSA